MSMRNLVLAILLGLFCFLTLPADAALPFINVVDYTGAPNNPGTDYTPGIEAAINAACAGDGPRAVYFPEGRYFLWDTVHLNPSNYSVKLFGAGIRRSGWQYSQVKPTQLVWVGDEGGTMIDVNGVAGFKMEDIVFCGDYAYDGIGRAGIGLNFHGTALNPAAKASFTRVSFERCATGFKCAGGGSTGDMTFIDTPFGHNDVGFHATDGNNMNFVFIRPEAVVHETIGGTTAFWFERGGNATFHELCTGATSKIIKMDDDGKEGGCISVYGWKPETYLVVGYRPTLLDIGGKATAYISSLCTQIAYETPPDNPPLFILRGSTAVNFSTSQIYAYKIASVGDGTGASLLTFNTCQFGNDPRLENVIWHDADSGYIIRDSTLGNGIINYRHDHALKLTPNTPTNLTAAQGQNPGEIVLNWRDNSSDEAFFGVARWDGAAWLEIGRASANATTYTDAGRLAGELYQYRVYVITQPGGVTHNWVYSNIAGAIILTQPDLKVKNHIAADFLGDNIYNDTGDHQEANASTLAGDTVTYDFAIQNDGELPDGFRITAPAGGQGWTVRYVKDFGDFADITAQVTGNGWITGEMAVGDTLLFHAEVTPDITVDGNAQKILAVRAVSALLAGPIELVRAITTNLPAPRVDATVRNEGGPEVGANVYGGDGAGQSVSKNLLSNEQTQFTVTLTNRGNSPDGYRITAPAGAPNWAVQYIDAAGRDITTEVTTTGFITDTLAVGASISIRVNVTPGQLVPVNSTLELLVNVASTTNEAVADAVKAVAMKAPISKVYLRADPIEGQAVGAQINLFATPVGGSNIEYVFFATDPNDQTTLIRDYGAGRSCAWTPAMAGAHQLTVWAREVGSADPFNAQAVICYDVASAALSAVSVDAVMQADKWWQFTATPTGGVNVQYKFRILSGSTWTDAQGYSTAGVCRWRPAKTGNFTVRAYAKETRGGRTVEFYADQAIRVTTVPTPPARLTAVRLAASPTSPRPKNTPITLTATPVGGTNVEYRFRVYDGKVWVDLQAFGPNKIVVWTPNPTLKTTYTLAVYAHEIGTSTTTQVTTSIKFVIQ